jgi:enolase
VLDILTEVIEKIAQERGERCVIALDIAASSFYNSQENRYMIAGKPYTADDLLQWYDDLTNTYPIFSIEDPFAENDWQHWHALTQKIGERIQVIGDDIFATHPERIIQGVERKAATGSIIKPNQIGTVTEALQAVHVCHDHEFNAITSHRSGDTEDDFIADFAVGANTGQIKAGGLTRSERLAKYNRLLVIEDHLKSASMGTE